MSWELDEATAVELIRERLDSSPPREGETLIISGVEQRDWGWIVSWEGVRVPGPHRRTPPDRGVYLVDRQSGRVGMGVHALGLDASVEAWRRGDLADLPPV
ncbi:hypothetical protein [Luteipulveratus mongoliensis]|nr:hypothetical protein [Luteipulveratus mongoliensis]